MNATKHIYHLETPCFNEGLQIHPPTHIYHPSRGFHQKALDGRSGKMIDVMGWGRSNPADKAAGYKMLNAVEL